MPEIEKWYFATDDPVKTLNEHLASLRYMRYTKIRILNIESKEVTAFHCPIVVWVIRG